MELAERVPEIMAALSDLGLVCIVKADGEREHKQWTVVVSGQLLHGAAIRVDGNSLDYCLAKALVNLREKLPTAPVID